MKKAKSSPQSNSTAQVTDARELITGSKHTKFPKINFGNSPTSKPTVTERCSSQTIKTQSGTARSDITNQTTTNTEGDKLTTNSTTETQTDNNTGNDHLMEQEILVSRVHHSALTNTARNRCIFKTYRTS